MIRAEATLPDPAEFTLLVACANGQAEGAGAARLRTTPDTGPDWSRVFELAVWHGVGG